MVVFVTVGSNVVAPLAGSDGIDGFIDVVGGHADGDISVVSEVGGRSGHVVP